MHPRHPDHDGDEFEAVEHVPEEDAEHVRSESQTAQDRDHVIRGGDRNTAPMKEFPS
jgi:hypothetical protein